MISLDYAQKSLSIAGLHKEDLVSPDKAVDALARPGVLSRYFSTTWAKPGGILEDLFCRSVNSFCVEQRAQAIAYISGKCTFEDVTRSFIKQLFSKPQKPVDFNACLAEFSGQREAIQKVVASVLQDCSFTRQPLHILGYGADDCSFEHDIGDYAVQNRQASGYKLYRYDPFAKPDVGITDITKQELAKKTGDSIDMVTARWVLHHVAPQARWGELRACLRRLQPQGHVVIVEQGDFADRDNPEIEERLYRFLVMANDVIANAALRPDWFTDTAPEFGADFDVDYLDESDLEAIEASFAKPFWREIRPVVSGKKSGETVIVYHVNH